MFLSNKKEIVLDCYTYDWHCFTNAKIDHAIKFIPDWWRSTNKVNENRATIKSCPGFIDYYKKGIVIPSWTEIDITIHKQGSDQALSWQSGNKNFSTINSHNQCQFDGFAKTNGHNLKIESPWIVYSKSEVKFLSSQPVWNNRDWSQILTSLPGILNFKMQHSTNINYFFTIDDKEKSFRIEPLTPLMLLHPMTEKKIVLRHHLIEKQRWEDMLQDKSNFFLRSKMSDIGNVYKKISKITKKIEEINK